MKQYKNPKNPLVLVLLLIMGGLMGDAVASVLPSGLAILKPIDLIGLKPVTLDIRFLKLTFGLTFDFGLLTVVGLIFGYLLYRKV